MHSCSFNINCLDVADVQQQAAPDSKMLLNAFPFDDEHSEDVASMNLFWNDV